MKHSTTNLKKTLLRLPAVDLILVATAIATFINLSVFAINKFSIWFDEAFGAYLIRFNFWDIAKYTAADVHPPLYYWLLKGWSLLFGTNEIALRSMSIFFGVVAIVIGYLLIKKLFGRKPALMSLLFMAISPMFIRYAEEARMYTLVTTIAFAATYALIVAMNSKKKLPWVIYGILIALGMWTHYFIAVVWIAHWIWRFGVIRRSQPKDKKLKAFFSKEWILAHAVAIGLFLPWLPICLRQIFVVQAYGFWIPDVTADTILNFLTNVVYYLDVTDVKGWLALALLALFVLFVYLTVRIYKKQKEIDRAKYRLIMMLAFAPIVTLFVISMPPMRSYFVDRYLITSAEAISIYIGVTIALSYKQIKTKFKYLLPIPILIMMAFGISEVYTLGNFNKNTSHSNNTRDIVEAIVDNSESTDQPIIAYSPYLFYEVAFYESYGQKVYFINVDDYSSSKTMLENDTTHKITNIDKFIEDNPVVWYVGYSDTGDLEVPFNCEVLKTIEVNDTVSDNPAYKAVQCKTN